MGDAGGTSARDGTSLGCQNGEHWSYAFGLVNTSKAPIRLTSARAPNPARAIADRVATQLRLSPPQPAPSKVTNGFGPPIDLVYRHWSTAPTQPVTIPPGRVVTVQSNFLMSHCASLSPGRKILIPATFALGYRKSGHRGVQELRVPSMRLVITPGVVPHSCDPVSGTALLTAVGLGCADARTAVQACNPLPRAHKTHSLWNGGLCTVSGASWGCGRFEGPGWPFLETCYLPNKSRWFSTVWIEGGLGLWGAVENRPAKDVNAPEAGPPTGGVCHVQGGTLVYESSALAVGGVHASSPARAGHVTFSIRDYHGPGTYRANAPVPGGSTAVQLATAFVRYGALVGKVRVVSATQGAVSGMVYVYLRNSNGPGRTALNGTWSCRA